MIEVSKRDDAKAGGLSEVSEVSVLSELSEHCDAEFEGMELWEKWRAESCRSATHVQKKMARHHLGSVSWRAAILGHIIVQLEGIYGVVHRRY